MFFIAGYEYHKACRKGMPVLIPDFARARVDEDLVLPGVSVSRRMSTRSDFKDSHAKIICIVTPADHNPSGNTFCRFIIKMGRQNGSIVDNLHTVLLCPGRLSCRNLRKIDFPNNGCSEMTLHQLFSIVLWN